MLDVAPPPAHGGHRSDPRLPPEPQRSEAQPGPALHTVPLLSRSRARPRPAHGPPSVPQPEAGTGPAPRRAQGFLSSAVFRNAGHVCLRSVRSRAPRTRKPRHGAPGWGRKEEESSISRLCLGSPSPTPTLLTGHSSFLSTVNRRYLVCGATDHFDFLVLFFFKMKQYVLRNSTK